MPWREASVVDQRREFVTLARSGGNIRELCRRFQVSAKTGYKWLDRFGREGLVGLHDRSRRPHHSPRQVRETIEERVVALRRTHPSWGGRKLRRRLRELGYADVPAPSTITTILRRRELLGHTGRGSPHAFIRFEADTPNELWQMDFKGHFGMPEGRCHPLTVLDDHSRFCTTLEACRNELGGTVKTRLESTFRRYGLPRRMLMDNGSPWGSDLEHPHTPLTAWLVRLGVQVVHSRPYHPQTVGKDERFHRTLKAEVISRWDLASYDDCQKRFDWWRGVYNFERPHDSLGLGVPAERYRPSERSFPEVLPQIEYGPGDVVRRVQAGGKIHFKANTFRVSKAFRGQPVALRATATDGLWSVYFCHQKISEVDMRSSQGQS